MWLGLGLMLCNLYLSIFVSDLSFKKYDVAWRHGPPKHYFQAQTATKKIGPTPMLFSFALYPWLLSLLDADKSSRYDILRRVLWLWELSWQLFGFMKHWTEQPRRKNCSNKHMHILYIIQCVDSTCLPVMNDDDDVYSKGGLLPRIHID